jgi:hypothetical protein
VSEKPIDATAFLALVARAAQRAARAGARITDVIPADGAEREVFDETIGESEYAREHVEAIDRALEVARAAGSQIVVGDDYANEMRDKRAGKKLVKLKLRRLYGAVAHTTLGDGPEVWTENVKLRDWIIMTYDEGKMDARALGALRRQLAERFGNVMLLPNHVEVCVFEEIE